MPTRFAVATGNWSNTAIWDNGALPQPGDDVYANGFIVTIDQNVNVGSIRNTAFDVIVPNIATPVMTSANTPSGIAFASVNNSYTLFDQSVGTTWQGSGTPAIVGYQFPSSKTIKRYAFRTLGNSIPTSWTFQGSNDGTTYTTLDTQTGITASANTWYNYSIANTTAYLYYRLNITAASGANPWLAELQMTESTGTVFGGTAGGSFSLNGGVTVNLTGVGLIAGSTNLINYSAASPNTSIINSLNASFVSSGVNNISTVVHSGTGTLTLNGNIAAIASTATLYVVSVTGTGTLNVNGNITTSITVNGGVVYGIFVNGACTLNVVGNLTSPTSTQGATTAYCIFTNAGGSTISVIGNVTGAFATTAYSNNASAILLNQTAILTITGTVTGGNNSGTGGAFGIQANTGSTINITGNVIGTGTNGAGIISSSTPTITVTGNVTGGTGVNGINVTGAGITNITGICTASTTAPAVFSSSTSATNTFTGPFVSNTNVMAVQVARLLLTTTPTYWRFQSDARTMYTADYAPDFPSTLNVRSGISYNGGLMTGTMIVPAANTVATGVPVDNTVGTAANSATAVQDAVWGKLTSTMTTSGSIGERVKNALTADVLGNLLSA